MAHPLFSRTVLAFTGWALGAALLALVLAAPAALAQPADTAAPLSRGELIERLQQGGHILLIRHERTEVPSREDDWSADPGECRVQRNLSIAGLAGARETGVVLRALDIPVGRVLSSPMCRSADTARLMFGTGFEVHPALMHHVPGENSPRDLDAAEAETRALIAQLAPELRGTNIAMVSHGGTVFRVSGLRVSEGEVTVLEVGEAGGITALGQFMGSDIAFYAREKLAEEAQE
ncbi:MAG: hypothetical protein AAF650_08265 [Pseudomonadota bacterium]